MRPWHLLQHQLLLQCQCGRTGPSPPLSYGCWSTQPSWRSREIQTTWVERCLCTCFCMAESSSRQNTCCEAVPSESGTSSWCFTLCPLQYSKHLFVHIGQTNPSYSDPLLEAVDIRQIYDKFPEKKGGLKELYEKGPQNAFFLVKFWVGTSMRLLYTIMSFNANLYFNLTIIINVISLRFISMIHTSIISCSFCPLSILSDLWSWTQNKILFDSVLREISQDYTEVDVLLWDVISCRPRTVPMYL